MTEDLLDKSAQKLLNIIKTPNKRNSQSKDSLSPARNSLNDNTNKENLLDAYSRALNYRHQQR